MVVISMKHGFHIMHSEHMKESTPCCLCAQACSLRVLEATVHNAFNTQYTHPGLLSKCIASV